MSTVHTEHVLVVPSELLTQLGYFQGFSHEVERYFDDLLSPQHTSYRPRSEMEQDPRYKQLIPYVVFRYREEDGETQLFQYRRGSGQGESRLHSKRSIGIGGHISTEDLVDSDLHPYDEGMRRELEEEVHIETDYKDRCIGLINDDETEVGRVHLGVVHLFDVAAPFVRPRESEIEEAGFQSMEQIFNDSDDFESWSQIALKAIHEMP